MRMALDPRLLLNQGINQQELAKLQVSQGNGLYWVVLSSGCGKPKGKWVCAGLWVIGETRKGLYWVVLSSGCGKPMGKWVCARLWVIGETRKGLYWVVLSSMWNVKFRKET